MARSQPVRPNAPLNLAGTPTATSVALTWDTVTGANSYRVYRDGTLIASPTTASYTDTGLTASTAYSYVVSAVNGKVEGPTSASITVTTTA